MSDVLVIERLTVALGGTEILHGLDLSLAAGAYGVVLGPSGSGKSTLLRAIAGLVPARGRIRIGDREVCAGEQVVSPGERRVGFLFQGLALWPHMTVSGHLRYALTGRRVPRAEHGDRVAAALGPLGLGALADRRPGELSGGERQRLALARALVTRPGLLLLDEPTSSVDPRVKRDVRDQLAALNREFGTTVLHVTHDQEEALELGDRLFVVDAGRLLQSGSPEEVYHRPAGVKVGTFLGPGGILPAVITRTGSADSPLGTIAVDAAGLAGPVWLLVRPEHLAPAVEGEGIPARVERVAYHGGAFRAAVSLGDQRLVLDLAERPPPGAVLHLKVVKPPRAVESRGSV